uniref:Retrovirus-related Pol polyprotein from transposon TNT 1-94 n=1 Tax=Tanacetum cinerariifolium TaxID=118510 RepID=A0A699I706_TANCI|nr:retrovirus-related Pol polyprotein from transposon TNT 1-94 [Tanacetum cinerariifolium]
MFENDNIIRRGHILNALLNPLFDVYQNYPTARELWKALKERFFTKDATRRLNMHTCSPSKEHWDAVNRVFKYLTKIMDYGLEYSRDPSVLEGYTDASWITDQEDYPQPMPPIYVHCDSQSTLSKAYNQVYNGKSGHIRLRDRQVNQLINDGVITYVQELYTVQWFVQRCVQTINNGRRRDRIMDSGASFHATYCKEELDRFRLRSGKVRLADGKTIDIAGVGDVVLKTSFGTSWTLKDVRYILGLKRKLISVRQLDGN